ncbi:MAG TPA: hypothetical protein VMS29_00125 [Pyrinomonadaceae bacterium]|nr:hypothetical protein [Pyrinomonadaceae bacterium]
MKLSSLKILVFLITSAVVCNSGCRSSGGSGGFEILSSDETPEAAKLVQEANAELKKIKVLYDENEDKRQELKNALESDNKEEVKKISDNVVQIINEGFDSGKAAVEKIQQAEDMKINDDYKEYLRLKEAALMKQMEAFEQYRQAARTLRDNYDPKNAQQRDKVKADFTTRSENYQKIMEKARDYSNQANELYKDALRRQQQQ